MVNQSCFALRHILVNAFNGFFSLINIVCGIKAMLTLNGFLSLRLFTSNISSIKNIKIFIYVKIYIIWIQIYWKILLHKLFHKPLSLTPSSARVFFSSKTRLELIEKSL